MTPFVPYLKFAEVALGQDSPLPPLFTYGGCGVRLSGFSFHHLMHSATLIEPGSKVRNDAGTLCMAANYRQRERIQSWFILFQRLCPRG